MAITRSISNSVCLILVVLLTACATTEESDILYGPVEVEKPTVGSRIKELNEAEDGAVPVRVFSREDMRRSGARSIGGFLGGPNN